MGETKGVTVYAGAEKAACKGSIRVADLVSTAATALGAHGYFRGGPRQKPEGRKN